MLPHLGLQSLYFWLKLIWLDFRLPRSQVDAIGPSQTQWLMLPPGPRPCKVHVNLGSLQMKPGTVRHRWQPGPLILVTWSEPTCSFLLPSLLYQATWILVYEAAKNRRVAWWGRTDRSAPAPHPVSWGLHASGGGPAPRRPVSGPPCLAQLHFQSSIKIPRLPMAQWERIHLPMQETRIWSLAWEDPTKPVSHSYWACAPQQEKPLLWEAHALPLEKSRTAKKTQHGQKERKLFIQKTTNCLLLGLSFSGFVALCGHGSLLDMAHEWWEQGGTRRFGALPGGRPGVQSRSAPVRPPLLSLQPAGSGEAQRTCCGSGSQSLFLTSFFKCLVSTAPLCPSAQCPSAWLEIVLLELIICGLRRIFFFLI